ncbi:aromatic acid exporter family protein [Brevibacillus sp. SYSU BS000544]|uniref:aromatic acid exporter family protein n=1 Tax=Brevibacillus sp. SYSU BS000544 TaxID=3416443 RepID=UPI003CE4EC41
MEVKIGYRTIKTAIGTALSIYIAHQFGLEFYASAGILTILCIQVTRKQSLRVSFERFGACLLGILFSAVFFEGLGYSPLTLMLMMFVYIPVVVRLHLKEGFVTSSVIILHLFTLKQVNVDIVLNELAIIGIGIGVALLANLYMPKADKELTELQEKIEQNFATILREYSIYLRAGESMWDGKEMIETSDLLHRAKSLALQDVENQFLRQENYFYHYFDMRDKQFTLLERILPFVSALNQQIPQGEQMADFLERLSKNVHPGNTAHFYLDKLHVMRDQIRKSPLPLTREEFETRASLYYLLNEIERYLLIKYQYKKQGTSNETNKSLAN